MTDKSKDSLLATAEEAANWHLVLEAEDTVSEAARRGFVRWLRRSPTNIEEFMRVSAMGKAFSDLPLTELPSIKLLIHAAGSNVVAINKVDGRQALSTGASPVARKRLIGSIAAMLVVAIPLLWLVGAGFDRINFRMGEGYVIATALGEQRSIVLPDGSVVNLNTQSRLEVNYSEGRRQVELTTGEAFFNVAKDAARPFRVHAGSAVVEAIGTQFNVYQQRAQTVITVVEGQVAVMNTEVPIGAEGARIPLLGNQINGAAVRLASGNQVAVSMTGAIAAKTSVDPSNATAWTDRRLVFDHDSLDIVVRELNRYNTKQLTIGDTRLSQRAISGVFSANDPAALVAFLAEIGGLHIETDASGNGWVVYAELAAATDSPD